MLNRLNRIFQKYVFKVRLIFSLDKTDKVIHQSYDIIKIDEKVVKKYETFFNEKIKKNLLVERINNEDCTGFLAVHKETNDPAGFEWCIVSREKEYRHDNFQLPKGYGLLFNAYVSLPHRRKGVFQVLKIRATKHLIEKEKCISALSVVEILNLPSIKGNKKLGSLPVGRNYLIKIFKRNLFSITKIKKQKLKIDYVLTGTKKVNI